MMMLPIPTDPTFPAALKQARLSRGLSRAELAQKAGISEIMIGRYEEPKSKNFTKPKPETWLALNAALGFSQTLANPVAPAASLTVEQLTTELSRRGFNVSLTVRPA
jgi:transcriptional regulator with XRE-family HTH domain